MIPIRLTASPGPDGNVHLSIPLPPGRYEVTVRPEGAPAGAPPRRVGRGWPPGFFDRTCGSMPDLVVPPDDRTFEDRESLD